MSVTLTSGLAIGKICSRCKLDLPMNEFYRSNRRVNGLQGNCKKCSNEAKKSSRRKNFEHRKEVRRIQRIKSKYGITDNDRHDMFCDQNGKCLICGIDYKKLKRGLVIDHDHKTNEIRGLLCSNCNTGLGYFKDNPDFLIKASEYLNKVT